MLLVGGILFVLCAMEPVLPACIDNQESIFPNGTCQTDSDWCLVREIGDRLEQRCGTEDQCAFVTSFHVGCTNTTTGIVCCCKEDQCNTMEFFYSQSQSSKCIMDAFALSEDLSVWEQAEENLKQKSQDCSDTKQSHCVVEQWDNGMVLQYCDTEAVCADTEQKCRKIEVGKRKNETRCCCEGHKCNTLCFLKTGNEDPKCNVERPTRPTSYSSIENPFSKDTDPIIKYVVLIGVPALVIFIIAVVVLVLVYAKIRRKRKRREEEDRVPTFRPQVVSTPKPTNQPIASDEPANQQSPAKMKTSDRSKVATVTKKTDKKGLLMTELTNMKDQEGSVTDSLFPD